MNRLSYDPGAIQDIRESFDWYARDNEDRALRFLDSVEAGCEEIVANPSLFPRFSRNTRRLVLQEFPFSLVYCELLDSIQILAVAHAKRQPGYWKNRI